MGNDVLHRIIQLMAQYALPNVRIQPTSRLRRDLGMDSMALVEFVLDLEGEFDVEIQDAETASSAYFGTVERVAAFINDKRSVNHASE